MKPVLGERRDVSLLFDKNLNIFLLPCEVLDNVLFMAYGTARFLQQNKELDINTHAGVGRHTNTQFSTHLCSGLTFPYTLLCPLHSFEIALQ